MNNIENSTTTFGSFTTNKSLINGGSPVKKYLLSKESRQYLLRLYDPRFIVSRRNAFDNIKKLYESGISVQEPIEFGICNNEQNAYMIVEWIDGKTIEDLLENCNDDQKLYLGIKSGQELLKLHSVNTQFNINLIEQYREKIKKKKKNFNA